MLLRVGYNIWFNLMKYNTEKEIVSFKSQVVHEVDQGFRLPSPPVSVYDSIYNYINPASFPSTLD